MLRYLLRVQLADGVERSADELNDAVRALLLVSAFEPPETFAHVVAPIIHVTRTRQLGMSDLEFTAQWLPRCKHLLTDLQQDILTRNARSLFICALDETDRKSVV